MRRFVLVMRVILEPFFVLAIFPAAVTLKCYRFLGSSRFPLVTRTLKKLGVFVIRDHYYEPMFVYSRDGESRVRPSAESFGFDLQAQRQFLSSLNYADELRNLKLSEKTNEDNKFYMPNHSFDSGDAEFLYSFVRYHNPAKVVEIGSGHSSKLVAQALERNKDSSEKRARHILIEPYPKGWLDKLEHTELIRSKIEALDFDWATELQSGDLLFIDSSHMVRPGGDVLVEYLEILPKLPAGVFIHIHDIFTPRDYLERWRENDVLFWNEQYMVEAILANSQRYSVLAALNFLKHECFSDLKVVCPYLDESREPGSLYLKVN